MIGAVSRHSVNPGLKMLFEEFVNHPDPFNLQPTIAALETLAVELRDSIETTNRERRVRYYQEQAMAIGRMIVRSELMMDKIPDNQERLEFAKAMVQEIYPQVQDVFDLYMGENVSITPDQAKTMAIIIEAKGKMVERYRKLTENTSIQLVYDDQLIQFMLQFVAQVVIPNISETKDRIEVAKAAKAFLPQLAMGR